MTQRQLVAVAGVLAALAVLATNSQVSQASGAMYAVIDLGGLGGHDETFPLAINNLGEVVGNSITASGARHAFYWSNGTMVDLGVLPGSSVSIAYGINDSGNVVGSSGGAGGFLYASGVMTSLGPARALAINNLGQITGQFSAGQAFRTATSGIPDPATDNISPEVVGSQGTQYRPGVGFAINDAGQVAGQAGLNDSQIEFGRHAFRTAPNAVIDPATDDLGALEVNSYSSGNGINEAGHVVGHSFRRSVGQQYAVLFRGGTLLDLGVGVAYDINNHDVVVGTGSAAGSWFASIWDDIHGLRNLNDLIPADSGWHLDHAFAINDNGHIVGYGIGPGAGVTGFLLVPATTDSAAPTVSCEPADALWHGSNVSITCTAQDSQSGLADPANASFSLTTSVGTNEENASASTGSRQVCDQAGNCSTAGPIGGNMVDRLAPRIRIDAPSNVATLTLGQVVVADYSCSDFGSGVVTCAGTVAPGSNVNTSAVGQTVFTVNAADGAGNSVASTETYTVSYGVCALYDPSKAHKAGSTIPIRIQLCDASGLSVSSPSLVVTAQHLFLASTNAPGPLEDSGQANPDLNFRYDASVGGSGGHVFNLSTKGLGMGTYSLVFMVTGDPVAHTVQFQVR